MDTPATEPVATEAPPAKPLKPIGRFIIGHATIHADWRTLLPLMAKCVILRAESLYHMDGIECLALCDDFEPVAMGGQVPFYDITCRYTQNTGEQLFVFTKHK